MVACTPLTADVLLLKSWEQFCPPSYWIARAQAEACRLSWREGAILGIDRNQALMSFFSEAFSFTWEPRDRILSLWSAAFTQQVAVRNFFILTSQQTESIAVGSLLSQCYWTELWPQPPRPDLLTAHLWSLQQFSGYYYLFIKWDNIRL